MAFPISIAGSFRIARDGYDRTTPEQIGFRVVHLLEKASASRISQDGGTVDFHVNMIRFVWKWNILMGIDSGRVRISDTGDALLVDFKFSLLRNFSIGIVVTCFMFYQLYQRMPVVPSIHGLSLIGWVAIIFPAVLCVNYIIMAVRLVTWLKRGCQDGWGSWL